MSIIGGLVRYEDGVRPVSTDQFAPSRKFTVELQFDSPTTASEAADMAIDLVNDRLGIKAPTRAAKLQQANKETAERLQDALSEIDAKKETKPKAPGRKPKIEVVAQMGVEAEEIPLGNAPTVVEQNTVTAAATSEDDLPPLGVAGVTSPAQPNASFSLDDLAVEPEVREISVQEMNNAAAKKMQGSKDPELSKKILAIIRSFNPDPAKSFQAKDIPQNQRQVFLDKLEVL